MEPRINLFQPYQQPLLCLCLGASLMGFFGCDENIVYQRSIAELNQKAQILMAQGDTVSAIGRLESARDLNPDEPITLYNLGIAYQAHGNLDQSIAMFEHLLELPDIKTVEQKNVIQSLAVVYEEKADMLIGQVTELEETTPKPSQSDLLEMKQQGLDFYGKARQTLEKLNALAPSPILDEHVAELTKTVEGMEKELSHQG